MTVIFLDYLYWHFSVAPREIIKIMFNYLKAGWHRFLIVQHFKTLFSAWHRQNPSDFGKRERTFGDKILDGLVDIYIRLIAAVVRSVIIISGLLWELFVLFVFLLIFLAWITWPVFFMFMISNGVRILI